MVSLNSRDGYIGNNGHTMLTGCEFSGEQCLRSGALVEVQRERRVRCRQKKAWYPGRSKNDEMPMITACFARVIKWLLATKKHIFSLYCNVLMSLAKLATSYII